MVNIHELCGYDMARIVVDSQSPHKLTRDPQDFLGAWRSLHWVVGGGVSLSSRVPGEAPGRDGRSERKGCGRLSRLEKGRKLFLALLSPFQLTTVVTVH